MNIQITYFHVFYVIVWFLCFVFADDSDVSATKHLHVYSTCLAERNRLFPHVWRPYVEDMEVRL